MAPLRPSAGLAPHVKIVKISFLSLLFLFLGGGNFATSDRPPPRVRRRRSDLISTIEVSEIASDISSRSLTLLLGFGFFQEVFFPEEESFKVNLETPIMRTRCSDGGDVFLRQAISRCLLSRRCTFPSAMKRYAEVVVVADATARNFLHQKRIVLLAYTFQCPKKKLPFPTIPCIVVSPVESPIGSLATMFPCPRSDHSMSDH